MKKSKSVRTDRFSSDLTYSCVCVCDFILSLSQGKLVGVFQKDSFTGEFVEAWKSTMASMKMHQVS